MSPEDRNAELSRRFFWLWFVAAALSLVAAGLDFYRHGTASVSLLAPAVVCTVMGFVTRARGRRSQPPG